MSELVQGGKKTFRDGLGSDNVNAAKLNDVICAMLCDAGMQALERATRSALVFIYLCIKKTVVYFSSLDI